MTRAQFLAFLARCAADSQIRLTEDEAADLLVAFDAGLIDPNTLPMPLDQGIVGVTREDVERVALVLIAAGLLRGNRERGRDRARGVAVTEARAYAGAVAAGDIPVADWQALMRDSVREHIIGQAVLGAGSAAAALTLLPQLNQSAQEQTAFLSRFADTVAVAMLMGVALSGGAIASRSVTYAGAGYAWFGKAKEAGRASATGYVVDYVARDDDRVCAACLKAEREGPYLVGSGPMPGDVCFGGGRCRCQRRERYDMKAWEKLTGR